jgi:hypothetical protein
MSYYDVKDKRFKKKHLISHTETVLINLYNIASVTDQDGPKQTGLSTPNFLAVIISLFVK